MDLHFVFRVGGGIARRDIGHDTFNIGPPGHIS